MLAHQAAQGDVTPLGLHPSPVSSECFTLHRTTCNEIMLTNLYSTIHVEVMLECYM